MDFIDTDTTPAYQVKSSASKESKAFMNALWDDANRKSEALAVMKQRNIGPNAYRLNPNQPWKDMRIKVATAIEMGRLPLDDFVLIQTASSVAANMVTPAPEQNSSNVENIVTKVIEALDAREANKQSSEEKPKEDQVLTKFGVVLVKSTAPLYFYY